MLHIILYGTEDLGNIGAIARLMANFGVDKLLFIEPKCNPLELGALKRAKHAKQIVEDAPLVPVDVLDQFDMLIGTTARTGDDKNIARLHVDPVVCMDKIVPLLEENHVGILFGPESTGLPNDLVEKCHMTVRIPTSEQYSSLNLSHAVGILLYELHRKKDGNKKGSADTVMCSHKTQDTLLQLVEAHGPTHTDKRDKQLILWKKIIGRSVLTEKEAEMLIGYFRGLKSN